MGFKKGHVGFNFKANSGSFKKGLVPWNFRHGMSKHVNRSKVYRCWESMKRRCLSKNSHGYKWYGKRGITLCKRWMKFENFYKDMGNPPNGLTLDRINNNKGYSKNNCRWTDKITQMNNTRKNKFLLYKGVKMTIAQWGRNLGISQFKIAERLNYLGWSIERALSTP